MNIAEILNGIKGSVLDLKDIELLKSAYELQNKVNDQLQSLNAVTADNNRLLGEKVKQLEAELTTLRTERDDLQTKVASINDTREFSPSELALSVMVMYRVKNVTEIWQLEFDSQFGGQRIKLESALHELTANDFLQVRRMSKERGQNFELTEKGRGYVLSIEEKSG